MSERGRLLFEWFHTYGSLFPQGLGLTDERVVAAVEKDVQAVLTGFERTMYETWVAGRDAAARLHNLAGRCGASGYAEQCYEAYVWMCRQITHYTRLPGWC